MFFFSQFLGGLGEAVAGAITEGRNNVIIKRLAVSRVARSGTCAQLMEMFEIDAKAVIAAVKEIIKQ